MAEGPSPLVAIQVGAASFIDEGVEPVLNIMQERAGVNALFLASPTWTRGTGGRQVPGHALPDHGVQEYDWDWVGGNYATIHPEHYGATALGAVGAAPEHPGWDLFKAVLPEAKRRGMASYAWIEESSYAQQLRRYPNFPKVLEVDAYGRPAPRPCFNNPDYRNWHLSIVEDYVQNYELDGLAWCSERPGPLNLFLQAPSDAVQATCFCAHCRRIAAERGIEARRAQEAYRRLVEWNACVAAGRPTDGAFVAFWRLCLQYPELLSWQTLWTESQRQLYRDLYGVAKACNPSIQVGWHVYHNLSFNPFYRADQDYGELSHLSDFIKVVTYNNCAGPRFHAWVENACRALFADATPEEVYPLLQKLLGIDEAPFAELPARGFSADYVRRETARAVAGVEGRSAIYSGIDIDIPVGPAARSKDALAGGTTGIGAATTCSGVSRCSRQQVKDAVLAAFAGGADGVVLSRKYSEMRLDNLAGAGDALRELAR